MSPLHPEQGEDGADERAAEPEFVYAEDLARNALGERLAEVLDQLRNVRRGKDDPETIHQLRVWSRRAEAALAVFEPFASPRRAKWLRRKLRKIRRAAGEARDADVLHGRWEKKAGDVPDAGWRKLLTRVERERSSTRRDVRRLARRLGRKDFGPRVRAFLKRVRERRTELDEAELDGGAAAFAHRAVAAAGRAFWKAEPVVLKNLDDLHQFRIEGKKLRYAIEACRAALPAASVDSCLDELTAIQDRLGKINDRANALARLEKWRSDARHPAALERLGLLHEAERIELAARVAGLADWWSSERRVSLRERLHAIAAPRSARRDGDPGASGPSDDEFRERPPLVEVGANGLSDDATGEPANGTSNGPGDGSSGADAAGTSERNGAYDPPGAHVPLD